MGRGSHGATRAPHSGSLQGPCYELHAILEGKAQARSTSMREVTFKCGGVQMDCYSLGVMLFVMLVGSKPMSQDLVLAMKYAWIQAEQLRNMHVRPHRLRWAPHTTLLSCSQLRVQCKHS